MREGHNVVTGLVILLHTSCALHRGKSCTTHRVHISTNKNNMWLKWRLLVCPIYHTCDILRNSSQKLWLGKSFPAGEYAEPLPRGSPSPELFKTHWDKATTDLIQCSVLGERFRQLRPTSRGPFQLTTLHSYDTEYGNSQKMVIRDLEIMGTPHLWSSGPIRADMGQKSWSYGRYLLRWTKQVGGLR